MKKRPVKWEKYQQTIYLIKNSYSKYLTNCYNSIAKEQIAQFKMDKGPEQTFFLQRRYMNGQQRQEGHWTPALPREVDSHRPELYPLTPIGMATVKIKRGAAVLLLSGRGLAQLGLISNSEEKEKTRNTKYWQSVEKAHHPCECNGFSHYRNCTGNLGVWGHLHHHLLSVPA